MILSLLPSLSSLWHYSLCVPLIFLSFHFSLPFAIMCSLLPRFSPLYHGSLPFVVTPSP
jgi:hypothetical protein